MAESTAAAADIAAPPHPQWLEEICSRLHADDTLLTNLNLNVRTLNPGTFRYFCSALRVNSVLEILNMTRSLVTITNLQDLADALAHHKSLRVLHLSYNRLTDVAPFGQALRTNTSLEELYLNYNQLQDIDTLCNGLRHNRTLKKVDLGKNVIRNVEALCDMLQQNNNCIEYLRLWWNLLDKAGVARLYSALEHNTSVTTVLMGANPGVTSSAQFQQFSDLLTLNAYGRSLILSSNVPHAIWPLVLSRNNMRNGLEYNEDADGSERQSQVDMIYYFLRSMPELMRYGGMRTKRQGK